MPQPLPVTGPLPAVPAQIVGEVMNPAFGYMPPEDVTYIRDRIRRGPEEDDEARAVFLEPNPKCPCHRTGSESSGVFGGLGLLVVVWTAVRVVLEHNRGRLHGGRI